MKKDNNSNVDLASVKSPEDIRKMDINQLKELADAMREPLIEKVSHHGGHVGPNLGMVEAIIALHYVFNTPKDKIVFDVSHQTYPHKMLTGRMEAFTDSLKYDTVTGYTQPRESEYDLFSLGHTSSAVALASGLAKARDLIGGNENVVAVIGDGSLSGGVAFEGLDYGATLGSNFIVVVNDNDMSIAENHGGIYADLRLLRNTNGTAENNLFRAMGYAYRYVHYGNDIPSLIKAFEEVKDIKYPVVVHINTMKGMGLPVAEANKEKFHWSMPFDPTTGNLLDEEAPSEEPADYISLFASHMMKRIKENPRLAVITAGTPGAIGFGPDMRREAGSQFIDVGIAEQQAIAMASGLAKGGADPVVGVVSTFLQRAYDQFSQDIALNHQPATFVVMYGSLFGMNDETHLGFFDLGLLSNIPDLEVLTPSGKDELISMLLWAETQKQTPVVVRIPGGEIKNVEGVELLENYYNPPYQTLRDGKDVTLIGVGAFLDTMMKAADILDSKGVKATVINPRSVSTLDSTAIDKMKEEKVVVTAEDGIIDGGYGQKVASALGTSDAKVINLGLPKEFLNRYNALELLKECGLTPDQIAEVVIANL
ncbi:MAG: 1-deoxy-D-xylulose-5-phosphate synthase [Muribaculaceae bacterium]|nr:1-deoxy-D-xylulose-5-phosphate synthase [Muribaculaceae bacterium]